MAKIVSRRIKWNASASPDTVGYKLYWDVDQALGYQSSSKDVGNVTSVIVPADVPEFPLIEGDVQVGVSAYDELGNESDITVLSFPFDFTAPAAPTGLGVEAV